MEESFYYTIPKGGVSGNNLYRQVKKRGTLIYVKCYYEHCHGSAKIDRAEFTLGYVQNDYDICEFVYLSDDTTYL